MREANVKILSLGMLAFLALSASAQAMTVTVRWAGMAACATESPPFKLGGVPKGTALLRFAMTDLDAPDYKHGGGDVAYRGQTWIPAGAFTYKGPCPPEGAHRYRWDVKALNASGRVLGEGRVIVQFPLK